MAVAIDVSADVDLWTAARELSHCHSEARVPGRCEHRTPRSEPVPPPLRASPHASVAGAVELREYAAAVLLSPALEAKLAPRPARLSDRDRGDGRAPELPARAPELAIVRDPKQKRKVPSLLGMPDPAQRRRILHGLANHELQAIELFAWAILRFPDAPSAFRRGLCAILGEEQLHFRLYEKRLAALGGRFGEEPLSGYFWSKIEDFATPARFVAAMSLTFENANLDHAVDLAAAARAAGDLATAAVLQRVHDDEVAHVRFGWRWLQRWKEPGQSMVDAYRTNIAFPLRPALARGATFHGASRERVGFDAEFTRMLEQAERPKSLYAPEASGRDP